jgi:hypothetical protein
MHICVCVLECACLCCRHTSSSSLSASVLTSISCQHNCCGVCLNLKLLAMIHYDYAHSTAASFSKLTPAAAAFVFCLWLPSKRFLNTRFRLLSCFKPNICLCLALTASCIDIVVRTDKDVHSTFEVCLKLANITQYLHMNATIA